MTEEDRDDLRALADSLTADALRLHAIEREKTDPGTDDPRLLELAREGEHVGELIATKTEAQRDLAEAITADADRQAS